MGDPGPLPRGHFDDIKNFFEAQQANTQGEQIVLTDWLSVGHVDEYVSFASDGHHVVVANPDLAYALLKWANDLDPMASMLAGMIGYNDVNVFPNGGTVHDVYNSGPARAFNLTTLGGPTGILSMATAGLATSLHLTPSALNVLPNANAGAETLLRGGAFSAFFPNSNNRHFRITFITPTTYKFEYQEYGSSTWNLDPTTGTIGQDAIFRDAKAYILANYWGGGATAVVGDIFQYDGIASPTLVDVPVMFRPDFKAQAAGQAIAAVAFTNNFVNAFVDGTTVIAAKSFGPSVAYAGAAPRDIFGDYAWWSFRTAGYTNIISVDDRYYHNLSGSVHCATNAIRAVPAYNWWNN